MSISNTPPRLYNCMNKNFRRKFTKNSYEWKMLIASKTTLKHSHELPELLESSFWKGFGAHIRNVVCTFYPIKFHCFLLDFLPYATSRAIHSVRPKTSI